MMNLEDFKETFKHFLDESSRDQTIRDMLKELIKQVIAEEEYDHSLARWED